MASTTTETGHPPKGSTTNMAGGVGQGKVGAGGGAALLDGLSNSVDSSCADESSYADIRAYSGVGNKISCYGRASLFDGASGIFVRDDDDTISDDNDGTVLIDAQGRRWKRQIQGIINLSWFAKGDGTDETSILSRVITYAAVNKFTLFWPPEKEYGFTNVSAMVAGGLYSWTGNPRLRQLSGRDSTGTVNGVEIGGKVIATVSLIKTALAKSLSVRLADASQVLAGDTIRLLTNRLVYGDHRFDPNNCFSQLVKVASVSGNVVTLFDPLVFDFIVAPVTTGIAQGGTRDSITLALGDTSTAHQLKNYLLTITDGKGARQTRYIHSYDPETRIASIGTTYTGFPQAPWNVIPDATSRYSVAAAVSAIIQRPAYVTSLANAKITGFPEKSVSVHGVQVSFCDNPLLEGLDISGFSRKALYSYHNYRPKISNCRFTGANEVTLGGGGLGYGCVNLGDFSPIVIGCTADNCRTGFDSINGTHYLLRTGNTVTGSGATYDGNSFWPHNEKYLNSGLSCHSATFGVTDISNQICDVYDNKQRGMGHSFQSNTLRGCIKYGLQPSYCTDVVATGNVYIDGMTVQPSSGTNGDINGVDGLPLVTSYRNRMRALVNIRQKTLVELASVTVKGNIVSSINESLIYVTDTSRTSDLALTVTDNDISVVADSTLTTAVIKWNSGTPNLRDLTAYNNVLRVGGASLGSVKADNMNKYPIIDVLPATSPQTFQIGMNQWLCLLQPNTLTPIPAPLSQSIFKLTIFEKDGLVENYFLGIVKRGSVEPILSVGCSGVSLCIDTPSGTAGTTRNLNFFNRKDCLYLNNLTSVAGKFVVTIE